MAITSYAPKVASPRIWRRDGAPTFWAYLDAPGRTFAGDAGDVADLAGNTRAGARPSGCTWADGPRGRCLAFAGAVDGGVDFAGFPQRPSPTSPFSVACRMRPTVVQVGRPLARWGSGGSLEFLLYFDGVNLTGFVSTTGSDVVTVGVTALPVGAWSHVALVYDPAAGRASLAKDGVVAATATVSRVWNATGALTIGHDVNQGQPFAGLIDDVRAYPRALSAAEVARDRADPDWRLRRPVAARSFAVPAPPIAGSGSAAAVAAASASGTLAIAGSGSAAAVATAPAAGILRLAGSGTATAVASASASGGSAPATFFEQDLLAFLNGLGLTCYPGFVPQDHDPATPALYFTRIWTDREKRLAGSTGLVEAHYQLAIQSRDYLDLGAISEQLRLALDGRRYFLMNGTRLVFVALMKDQVTTYEQSADRSDLDGTHQLAVEWWFHYRESIPTF